ncbi:MAG: TM0106 family RecB-like putative nuclease [Planctomycetes bacterium]|nr:TM0106 family RecB-like putative nuclease [Planctomycetota bacterium]
MRLSASDFQTKFRPSECDLRIYLRNQNIPEAEPGPYEQVLRILGQRHEERHLATFEIVVDLSQGSEDERFAQSLKAIEAGKQVLYQPVLITQSVINNIDCIIRGDPDFLINENGEYVIRDCKMSRRINNNDHPEILRQLELYGWLYEKVIGKPSRRLEVLSGASEIVEVPYDGGAAALELLGEIAEIKQCENEPFSPVGWTKCGSCPFHNRCWPQAEQRHDVALVLKVDKGLARALRDEGVNSYEELLDHFDEKELAEFKRPWGTRMQRVGKNADQIIRSARSLATGNALMMQTPEIPASPYYVMFDLEGLPPQLDELDKVYLWGLQVFGEQSGEFIAAVAGFGERGDEEGWNEFLQAADRIFDEHADIPFVHWHHYERVKIDAYVKRYGDTQGIAARVRSNLLDLLPITQKSIVLPLPSYSLKVVEHYVGFERKEEEYGGDWAMAKYIEATETEDEGLRKEVMDLILAYNREDLEATWAVFQWLRSQ